MLLSVSHLLTLFFAAAAVVLALLGLPGAISDVRHTPKDDRPRRIVMVSIRNRLVFTGLAALSVVCRAAAFPEGEWAGVITAAMLLATIGSYWRMRRRLDHEDATAARRHGLGPPGA